MALSGTFKSSQVTAVGDYPSYVYVQWSATQNISNNTSTISWKCYGGSYYSNEYRWTTTGPVVVKINGQTVLNKTNRFNMKQGDLIGSGSLTVQHNTDGTKSVGVSISAAIYYGTTNSTYDGTISLNTIPRASAITSAASITLGNRCNIKWIPASKNFKYKIEFKMGSWNKTTDFIIPNSTTEYTYAGYTIPADDKLYSQIPNTSSGTMTATLYTYNSNGSLIGKSEPKSFVVTVPTSVKPKIGSITLDPEDITINGTKYNYLVKGKNKLTITVNGVTAGAGSSSIKSYNFSGPSISTTTQSNSVTIASVNTAGLAEYTVIANDQREDRKAKATATIECYNYYDPSISLKVSRNKTTLTCTYNVSYASIDGKNSSTVRIYVGSSCKKTISNVNNGASGKETITLDSATDTYTVYATITDGLGTIKNSNSINVYGAPKVMNITADGTGVAFGKMAEEKNCVDIPKLWSRGGVTIKNNGNGLYIKGLNTDEPAIYRNTSGNLWIGAKNTTKDNITGGGTYISTGDKKSLYVGKPLGTSRAVYPVLDSENCRAYIPMWSTELYNNPSGIAGTVTLYANTQNYSYIEIFYREDNTNPTQQSVRYWVSSEGRVDISSIESSPTSGKVYLRTSRYVVSGKSLQFIRSKCVTITNGSAPTVAQSDTTNYFKIVKVIGYSAAK